VPTLKSGSASSGSSTPPSQDQEMTKDEIQNLYHQLETLSVRVERNSQRGLGYLADRMMECRQKQDQATDILLKVNRAHATARTSAKSIKSQISIIDSLPEQQRAEHGSLTELKERLNVWESEEDELRFLGEVVRAKISNLKMTSSDIRLLCSVVEQQIRLGEIQPERGRGTMEKPKTEPVPQPQPTTESEATSVSETVPQPDLGLSIPADSGVESTVSSIEDFLADK
jgi:hypothetical protein